MVTASENWSTCRLIVPLVLILAGSAQAEKQFRWKLESGDTYRVEVNQDLVQTVMIGDETIEIPSKISMTLSWRVTSTSEDGTAELSQTIDQVVISMTVPGISEDVRYDSSAEDEPSDASAPIADIIGPMIGARFTQTMDASGRIVSVDVPKGAFEGLESNKVLEQFFSGEAFKQLIAKASPVFPEEPIAEGHSWQSKGTQETPLGISTFDNKFTYQGQQQKDDRTLDKFSVVMTMGIKSSRMRGTKIEIAKQDNRGVIWFDQQEGFLTESTLNQSVSMKVTSGDTVVDQTVTNEMILRVTKE